MHPNQPSEQLLEQVLCGDRPADDPEFLQLLQSDPQVRTRWDRMRALTASLDELGAAERSLLASTGDPLADSEERVAQLVRSHLPRLATAHPRAVPRWVWLGALAAGLALLLWINTRTPIPALGPTSFDEVLLGEGSSVLHGMTTEALPGRAYQLAWEDREQGLGRTYFVHFHERDGAQVGAALEDLRSSELLETHWTFTLPAALAPEHLAWSVEVRDVAGNPLATGALQHLAPQRAQR